MATTPFRFLQRRTSTSGRVPDVENLLSGELYIQLADETIYFRNDRNELVAVITDGDKFGLDKIKFTGASSGDFAVWNGSKFVPYSTGGLVGGSETGALASVFAAINHAHAQYVSTGSTGSFVTASQTGSFITTSMTGAFGGASGVDLTSYVTTGSTGSFVTTSQTGSFITTSMTGAFGGASGVDLTSYVTTGSTGNFVTTSQTGAFAPTGDYVVASATGSFVTTSQTGSFITTSMTGAFGGASGVDLTSYVTTGSTGNFVTTSQTGAFAPTGDYVVASATGSFVTTSQTGAFAPTGDYVVASATGSFVTTAQTGSFITTSMTGAFGGASGVDLTSYVTTGSTGSFVTTSQTGAFAPTGDYVVASATGSFVTTSQTGSFASINGGYLLSSQIPTITGDICVLAGTNNALICQLQGYPVSTATPINGQTLQFNGTSWVPGDIAAGGNGGGGLVYYFNETIAADLPTGSLPAAISGVYELGRSGMTGQFSLQTPNLPTADYTGVVGFVTDVLDPNISAIPAGLFDFNFWASSNTATQTIVKLEVYKYDGATTTATLIATSDDIYTYDGAVTAQYIASVVLPQTTITSTDRLYIRYLAKALGNNKKITFYFGGVTPSHVHTTFPSVGGSGLVKVINGIMQGRASLIIDSDISGSAAIAGSKIQSGYFALASATGGFVTTGQSGQFVGTGQTGQYVWTGSTGNFVTTSQTGQYVWTGSTGRFVTTGQTGVYETTGYARNCYVTTGQTGSFGGGVTCNIFSGTISGLTCLGDLCVSGQIFGTGLILGRSLTSNSFILGPANFHSISPAYSYPGFNLYFGSGHRTSDDGYGIGSSNIAIGGSSINFPGNSNSNTALGSFSSTFLGNAYGSANNHIILNSCCVYVLGSNVNSSNKSASINVWCGSLVNVDNATLLNTVCSNIDHSYFSLILNSCRSNIVTTQYTSRNTYINGFSGLICGNGICDVSILHGMRNCITGQCLNNISLIGSGLRVTGSGLNNIHILGSNITGSSSNTVYVNNLCVVDGIISGNGAGITGLATGNFVVTSQTGAFAPCGSYVTTSQTGAFAPCGSYVTTSQTGAFAPCGSYVTTSQTGSFVTTSQTGAFAPCGSYVTTSQTGQYVSTGSTGNFVSNFNTQSHATNINTNSCNCIISGCAAQVFNSAILAGSGNRIVGSGVNTFNNAIIGGLSNIITGNNCESVMLGGYCNRISGNNLAANGTYNATFSEIGTCSNSVSIVGGGYNKICCANNSAILAGYENCICGSCSNETSTIVGGRGNRIFRSGACDLKQSVIIGGYGGRIYNDFDSMGSAIIAGSLNQVSSTYSAVLGGDSNSITHGCNSTVLGGSNNRISGSCACQSTIIGGSCNFLNDSTNGTILGGCCNTICTTATMRTVNSMIIGGSGNCMSGVTGSLILGGSGNAFRCGVRDSIILGGDFITGTASRTAYAENFSTYFCSTLNNSRAQLSRDYALMTCTDVLGCSCSTTVAAGENCFYIGNTTSPMSYYEGRCDIKGMCRVGNTYTGNAIIQCEDVFLPSIVPSLAYTGSTYLIKGQIMGNYSSGTTYHRMYREFTEIYRATGDFGFARDFTCQGISYASDATNFGTGKALICLLNGRPTFVSLQRSSVPASATIPTCTQFGYNISVHCLIIDAT